MFLAAADGLLRLVQVPKLLFLFWALRCSADVFSERLGKELLVVLLFLAGVGAFQSLTNHSLLHLSTKKLEESRISDAYRDEEEQEVPLGFQGPAAQDDEEELIFNRPRSRKLSTQRCLTYDVSPPNLPEGCRTLVLKGVPTRYTPDRLCRKVQGTCSTTGIDYLFLPPDPKKPGRNLGLALVHFNTSEDCEGFCEQPGSLSKLASRVNSSGVLQVSAARSQSSGDQLQKMLDGKFLRKLAFSEDDPTVWFPRGLNDNGQFVRISLHADVNSESASR